MNHLLFVIQVEFAEDLFRTSTTIGMLFDRILGGNQPEMGMYPVI